MLAQRVCFTTSPPAREQRPLVRLETASSETVREEFSLLTAKRSAVNPDISFVSVTPALFIELSAEEGKQRGSCSSLLSGIQ